MAVVINDIEVITDVVTRPGTDATATQSEQRTEKPLEFDEIRRRLDRAFRLASRLTAD
jgi:hypothetical protein